MPKTALAERFLREAVQTAGHPGIAFRDGAAGRRAGVIGGPDVWELIDVWRDEGRRAAGVATTLKLPPGLVAAAVAYYADNREEIDGWIDRNRALSEEAEAAALRRQALSQE